MACSLFFSRICRKKIPDAVEGKGCNNLCLWQEKKPANGVNLCTFCYRIPTDHNSLSGTLIMKTSQPELAGEQSLLERVFKLRQHGTTARTETIAGFTTFLTMVYIVFVNKPADSGCCGHGYPSGVCDHLSYCCVWQYFDGAGG